MAIIKCPECEGKLSTEAKRCVHCGCEFTVCKECGTVVVGKPNVCSECGYVFEKKEENYKKKDSEKGESATQKSDDGTKNKTSAKGVSILKETWIKWDNECGRDKLKIFKTAITVICVICFAVAAIQFATVGKWGFDFNDKMDLMLAMLIVIAGMGVLKYAVMTGSDFVFISKMPTWAQSAKVDLNASVLQYMQNIKKEAKHIGVTEEVKIKGYLKDVLKALAFKDDCNIKNRFMIFKIFEILLKAVSSGFICAFVVANVKNIATVCVFTGIKPFFEEVFSFDFIEDWWLLIVGVAVGIGKFIYNCVIETQEDTCIEKWFFKNYSEYSEEYRTYVMNPFENSEK